MYRFLLAESIEGLNIRPDGTYVDLTYGGGGHSRHILERLGKKGKLYASIRMRMPLQTLQMINGLP